MSGVFFGKKGGGGGSSPTRTPDTLRADDTVEVVLAISEGPCEGLADGAKSFFIGDTALQASDGSNNFQDFELQTFAGSEVGEDIVSEMGGFATNTTVQVAPAFDIPVVRTTSTHNINFLELRVVVSQLLRQDDGGTFEHSLSFDLEYKATTSSTWLPAFTDKLITISGKTTSNYPHELRWAVPEIDGTYDIRITRVSPASTSTEVVEFSWESFQEVTKDPLNLPGTSAIKLITRASDQFSSIPDFLSIWRGRLVRVPSNLDQTTNTYTGIWNGTFKIEWTDRPAWIIYDLVMNTRYGLAAYRDVDLNKYDCLEADKWWSTEANDGSRRFTMNLEINKPRPIKELATYIAGAFGGRLTEDYEGNFRLRIDDTSDAVQVFAEENISGDFTYSYTDINTRPNHMNVAFVNPDLNWEEDHRIVEDPAAIALHGKVPADFLAVGCKSAGEAVRRAVYRVVSAQTETTTVVFDTAREGIYCEPNNTILVVDPSQGNGLSGRVRTRVDNRTISLRDAINIEAGFTYEVKFSLATADGFQISTYTLDATNTGPLTQLVVTSDLDPLVLADSVFAVSNAAQTGLPRPFRVTNITPSEENPDLVSITAIEKNPAKWPSVDASTVGGDTNFSSFSDAYTSPVNNLTHTVEVSNGNYRVNLTWDRSSEKLVRRYDIYLAENGGVAVKIGETRGLDFKWDNVPPGVHDFSVVTVGIASRSRPEKVRVTLGIDDNRVVPAITNLRLRNGVWDDAAPVIEWDHGDPDPYFSHYRVRVIGNSILRTTENPTGTNFAYPFNKNEINGPDRTLTFGVSKTDLFGNFSAEVQLTASNPAPALPSGETYTGEYASIGFQIVPNPADADATGVVIHGSTVQNFTPGPSNQLFFGQAFTGSIPITPGSALYLRTAVMDRMGTIDANFTAPELVVVTRDVTSDDVAPGVPSAGAIVDERFFAFDVTWVNPLDPDFDVTEVLVSETNDPQTATVVRSTSGTRETVTGVGGVALYVWL